MKKTGLTTKSATLSDCFCQSGLPFGQCCQPYLDASSSHQPATAEQLMRSRYCAYVLKNSEYLLKTWRPDQRPSALHLENSPNQWIGLNIKNTHQGSNADTIGQVHFIARYKINGKAYKLEENSQFEKINGQWFYSKGVGTLINAKSLSGDVY